MDETALFSSYKSQRTKGHKKRGGITDRKATGDHRTGGEEKINRLSFLYFFSRKQRR
jgi:hypothetical protein